MILLPWEIQFTKWKGGWMWITYGGGADESKIHVWCVTAVDTFILYL